MWLYPAAIPFWTELVAAYPGVRNYPILAPLVQHLRVALTPCHLQEVALNGSKR